MEMSNVYVYLKLTYSQGKSLIKLINRECKNLGKGKRGSLTLKISQNLKENHKN